jgi:16S rRNA processing protein RimM
MEKDRYISIGKISGPHGFKGTLKMFPFSESTDFFEPDKKICVRYADGRFSEFTVGWIKPHKKGFLLFFKETVSAEMAVELTNAELLVERKDFPETESDVYYWVDLIGLSVFTTDGEYLGKLESIFPTGSNDVFVVKRENTETLIPALESVVEKVDLEEKIMRVRLPEGL